MKLEKIITILIVLLVIITFLLISSESKRSANSDKYERLRRDNLLIKNEYNKKLDSLDNLLKVKELEHSKLKEDYNKIKVSSEKITKQYEKLLNSRPISYTDTQIDSIVTIWYPE